jgi:hypothetical protein
MLHCTIFSCIDIECIANTGGCRDFATASAALRAGLTSLAGCQILITCSLKNPGKKMRKLILIAAMAATLSGCQSNGYYSPTAPSGYYYSDPDFCQHGAVCPLLIAAAIGGVVAVASHH